MKFPLPWKIDIPQNNSENKNRNIVPGIIPSLGDLCIIFFVLNIFIRPTEGDNEKLTWGKNAQKNRNWMKITWQQDYIQIFSFKPN